MIVDFHSHILPGIDDGSANVVQSVAMLRAEAEQGIGHVVATPHFYARHDTPERFISRRDRAEAALMEELEKHSGLPRVSVGAEVYYYPGISDSEALTQLAIRGTEYVLIEMPRAPWTGRMYQELEGIYTKRGLTPIVAHVDRYMSRFRTFRIPERLDSLPVLVQANAEFFLKRSTAGMALKMLKAEQIHLLGSDCHDMDSRKPNLQEALQVIEKRLGKDAFQQIRYYEREVLPNL